VKTTGELLGDGFMDDDTRVVVFACSTTCRYETIFCASRDGEITQTATNTMPTKIKMCFIIELPFPFRCCPLCVESRALPDKKV
jgi:hypothetical protein